MLPKLRKFFPLFYNRLHFRTFGILFQFDRNLLPAVNSQYTEFSYPVKRTKSPNFGIEFRMVLKILIFGIIFQNYGTSLVAQTEQIFTIFGIFTTIGMICPLSLVRGGANNLSNWTKIAAGYKPRKVTKYFLVEKGHILGGEKKLRTLFKTALHELFWRYSKSLYTSLKWRVSTNIVVPLSGSCNPILE